MFKCFCVCMHIMFFQSHITRNACWGYIDTERAVMWPVLSKMLYRKQANYQVSQLQKHKNWEITFRYKLYVSVWRMNWWCACFSARHLGECWSHDSPFCVNVTPTCIFGYMWPKKHNVQVKNLMCVQTQTHLHTNILTQSQTHIFTHLQKVMKVSMDSVRSFYLVPTWPWLGLH